MSRPRERSESQLDALHRRDSSFRLVHEASIDARDRRATTHPRGHGPLLAWFHQEWDADFPTRVHERGIEPDSQLGAPALAGAMRHRLTMAVDGIGVHRTDYDPAKDTYSVASAPRFPIMDALARLRATKPLIADSLEKLARSGFDMYRHGDGRGWQTYQTETYMRAEMDLLWMIWSRGQQEAGKDAA